MRGSPAADRLERTGDEVVGRAAVPVNTPWEEGRRPVAGPQAARPRRLPVEKPREHAAEAMTLAATVLPASAEQLPPVGAPRLRLELAAEELPHPSNHGEPRDPRTITKIATAIQPATTQNRMSGGRSTLSGVAQPFVAFRSSLRRSSERPRRRSWRWMSRGANPSGQAPSKSLQIAISCAWQESNLRPRAPEARALSPELQALGRQV